jgi:type IX secretion system PorP/SprF family membrane protein
MKINFFYIIILITLSCKTAYCQQEAQWSQYMFNNIFVNPASVGTHEFAELGFIYRAQWIKYKGAPQTAIVSYEQPSLNGRSGFGFSIVNDRIGVSNTTDINLMYSLQMKLSKKAKLSFGIKAGVANYIYNANNLLVWDANDAVYNTTSTFVPKLGLGLYYFTKKGFIGVSSPVVMAFSTNESFNLNVENGTFLRRHIFAHAGRVFSMGKALKIKPAFLVKYQTKAPIQYEPNVTFFINDIIGIGFSYRSNDAAVAMLQIQSNKFRIGYAYDYPISKILPFANSSHEIMLGYSFINEVIKIKHPRYF